MSVLAAAATAVFNGDVSTRAAEVLEARAGVTFAPEVLARSSAVYAVSSEAVAQADGLFDARSTAPASALADFALDGADASQPFPGAMLWARDPVGDILVDFDLELSPLGSLIFPLEFDGSGGGDSTTVVVAPTDGTVSAHTDDYTIAPADAGGLLEMSKASAVYVTVPSDASAAFALLAQVNIAQTGAGQVTVRPALGVTLLYSTSLTPTTRAQNSLLTVVKVSANTWRVAGDMQPIDEVEDSLITFFENALI